MGSEEGVMTGQFMGLAGTVRRARLAGGQARLGPWTRRGLLAAVSAAMAAASVGASDAPAGPVILTVTGELGDRTRLEFDLAMLQAMPVSTIQTSTPWTDGVQTFSGVALADFLDAIGVASGSLHCLALNQYSVEIPVEDATMYQPIIAYLREGQPMTRRNKGPLWVVYPFDSSVSVRHEHINSRSIWHLTEIEVRQ